MKTLSPLMKKQFTPKQVGQALGVSEASIKRWCDRGTIPTTRTAGGHRRIAFASIVQYLRDSDHTAVRPELVGLPPVGGTARKEMDRAAEGLLPALEAGDDDQVRQIVLNLYLAGKSCCEIFDNGIAPAFHRLGERWDQGSTEVYEERRACEIATRVIHELRLALPPVPSHAPSAVGGALGTDPYTLPSAMVEVTLRECGWNATSLGIGLPVDTFVAAVHTVTPRLVWVTASAVEEPDSFRSSCATISSAAAKLGGSTVVGGRALAPELLERLQEMTFCECMASLRAHAQSLTEPD